MSIQEYDVSATSVATSSVQPIPGQSATDPPTATYQASSASSSNAAAAAAGPTTVPTAALPSPATVNPQDELERRKARAARFGIPLVDEIKKAAPPTTRKAAAAAKA